MPLKQGTGVRRGSWYEIWISKENPYLLRRSLLLSPLFELEFISQHQVKNTTIEKRRKREDGTFLSSFEIGMLTLVKVWFHSFSKWRNIAVRKYRMIQCTEPSFLEAYWSYIASTHKCW